VSLAELRALDDGSVLQDQWIGEMVVRWAARRAAASQTGSDGAAWLDGKAASAVSCDATLIPVVTGGIDPAALDDLVTCACSTPATARTAPATDPAAVRRPPTRPSSPPEQASPPQQASPRTRPLAAFTRRARGRPRIRR
jgi:hypothetical protein